MPVLSLRHQGAFYQDSYVIFRGERICKDPTIFEFYSVVIERSAANSRRQIPGDSKSATKKSTQAMSWREFSLAQNENSGTSIRRKKLVADRKSEEAIFSA